MKYLVTMELVETALPAILASPQATVQHIEQRVIPTHEALMKLEAERKILAGGALVGRRANAFIVEAASNEELSRLLMSLPLSPMMKVEVTPLQSFEDIAAQVRQNLERLKAALK